MQKGKDELFRLGATTYLTSELWGGTFATAKTLWLSCRKRHSRNKHDAEILPRGFPPQGTDLLSTIFNKRLRWVVTVSCLAVF